MANFKFTPHSLSDIETIAEHTLRTWGENQCERYLAGLQACFQELVDRPRMGRSCDDIRPGLMRMEHGRHVIFYRQKEYGIRIIRVPRQKMLPGRHSLDDHP